MALVVWLELAVNGSCVYSCLFTVVKDHRTLLLLVQATHQIMQLALHRWVASLFDPTRHSHYEASFLHLGRVSGPLYSRSLLILHSCHIVLAFCFGTCSLLWLSAGSSQKGPRLLNGCDSSLCNRVAVVFCFLLWNLSHTRVLSADSILRRTRPLNGWS